MKPRPAATVIVARPAEEGVEVLVLRRAGGSAFGPGFVVFPGGTIESGDEGLAARLFGNADQEARACAVRELCEETSLLCHTGSRGVDPVPDGVEISAAWWARPVDVLGSADAGLTPLMWPTRVTLEALAECPTVADVLDLEMAQVPPRR
jgi:8-oxo-dGTP pyrophosphatase MutT (NUDIX family)